MKKIYFFITMLASLCAPATLNAQDILTIGTDDSYSSTSDGLGSPMGRAYYYNSTAQFIYTASELASMGGAKAITSVAFYHNAYSFVDDVQIYLAHTAASTVDVENPATTGTLVYSGTGITVGGGSEGWQTFEFDEPFDYNGTSNLLVVVCRTNSSGYSSNQAWQYTETTDNKYMVRHDDNTAYGDISNTSYSYTASTKRPNIQITYTEPASCPKPTQLAVNSVDSREVELSWFNLNHGSGTWWIQYSEFSDFSSSYLYGVSTTTYMNDSVVGILDGLDPATTYYARVQLDCGGGDESQYSNMVSFTTLDACPAPTDLAATDITASSATLGWTSSASSFNVRYRPASAMGQDFESGLGDWTTIDADGDGYTWILASETPGVYHKTGVDLTGKGYDYSVDFIVSASFSNYTGVELTPDNYLVSPQVPLGGSVSFYAQAQDKGYPAEHFGVAVSTTGNTDAADFTTIQEWTMVADYNATEDGTWGYYSVDLSDYAGQTGYVAIRHFDCTNEFMINIDNIEISFPMGDPWVETTVPTNNLDIASGLEPETNYEFEVQSDCGSDGTSTWAHANFSTLASCMPVSDLSFDEATTTTATITWTAGGEEPSWEVYLYDEYDNIMTGYPQSAFTTTYTFADLSASTTYKAGVKANCFGPTSAERKVEMHTACGAINTLPYVESFENDYDNACWIFNGFDKLNPSVYAHDGDAIFYVDGTELTPHYAILPIMSTDISELMMNFWYFNLNSDLDCGTLRVGYVTNAYDISTFTEVGSIDMSSGISVYERTQNFVFSDAPAGSRMALYYEASGVEYSYLIIDDFTVDVLPSCMAPYNLVAYASTSHGASFDWTNGGSETAWQLYFSETNEAPDDDIDESLVTDATSNPFTLASGLNSETDYYAWVRATCGGSDGNSAWVGPVSFTTDIACPAPTDMVASNITGHTADLDWTGTSSSYIVSYRTAFMPNPDFSEDFSTASCPDGWTRCNTLLTDNVLNGTTSLVASATSWVFEAANGVFDNHVRANLYGANCKYWLITPSIDVTADNALAFDMALTTYYGTVAAPQTTGTDDKFVVLISTDGGTTWTILRQWDNAGSAYVLNDIVCSATGENVQIDLSAYDGESVKIAFYTESTVSNADNNLHIDNVMVGIPAPAGEWQTAVTNTASYSITGLNPETRYEAKVQGDCGSEGMSQETAPIAFTTDIACMPPTELTAGIPGPTYVDLYWMENGSATDWDIYVNGMPEVSVSAGETEVTIVNDTVFYTLTGLVAGLDFSVKVRSNCGGEGLSGWSNVVDFTTANACPTPVLESAGITDITANSTNVSWIGFTENDSYEVSYRMVEQNTFINADFEENAMPAGWTSEGDGTWGVGTGDYSNSPGAHGGSYNARIVHSANNNETYLVTPNMDLTGSTDVSINLWYINRSWGGDIDEFGVYYRLDGGEWNEVFLTSEDHSDWTQLGVELPAAAYTANCQIGFKMVDHYGYGVGVDDITMTGIVNVGAWQTINTTSASATLTGLDPETNYEVKVKGFCYGGAESNESTIVNFTTLSCDVTSFPWTEDFEYMAENTVPECWDNSASTSPTLYDDPEYIWGVYRVHDNRMMRMYNYYVEEGDALINSPVIELPAVGVYALSFAYAHRATCGALSVNVSTDNGVSFVTLKSFDRNADYSTTDPGEFTHCMISLADYAGESIILQFYAEADYGDGSIFVDDVTIAEAPSCFAPSSLAMTSVTTNSATLNWDENGTATTWQICLDGDEANLIEATSKPFTIEGLEASTEYTVKVRAYCAADDQSEWSDAKSFVTNCEAIPVMLGQPYVQDFENPELPCMRTIDALHGYWRVNSTRNHTASGSKSAYSYYYGDIYLILPDLAIEDNLNDDEKVTLSFWSYNIYPSAYDKNSVVLLDAEDHVTTELWSPAFVEESWEETTIDLTSYKGQTIRLAFKYEGDDAHGWYLDDIKVGFTCPAPADLAVEHLSDHSTDLTWTGRSESYTMRYREIGTPTSTQIFSEGFESYANETELEEVWSVIDLGDEVANTDELGLYDGDDAIHTGSYGFRFSSYYGDENGNFSQYLISPDLPDAGLLEFSYRSSDGAYDVFRVGYSTTTNDIAEFTWGEVIRTSEEWQTFSEIMPEDAKYFAINYTAVYQYWLLIDDIAIYEVQRNAWQIVNDAESPVEITGLEAATQYEAMVQGDCGVDGVSPWSHTLRFTTQCAAVTDLPWIENFEGFPALTVPACWDNSASSSNSILLAPQDLWGVYEYSGNKMLRMFNYNARTGTALINSPIVDLPAGGDYSLYFDYAHNANCGDFIVKISNDYGETFVDLDSYSQDGSGYTDPGEFTSAEISLANYDGQSVILQFFANANFGGGAIFLDNVQIKCGDVVVDWEHPFTEGFEGAFPPACWDTINMSSHGWTDDDYYHYSGSHTASSGYYGDVYLVMPEITIEDDHDAATLAKLTFWSYNDYTQDGGRNSVVLLDGGETELWSIVPDEEEWVGDTIDLTAYKGQTIRLAFKYEGHDGHGWYVDDVNVSFYCPAPTNLAANHVTKNSADLSWTAAGTEPAWQIMVNNDENNLIDADANPFTVTGLSANTTYTARVRAFFSPSFQSDWSEEVEFTTKCDAITSFPWNEDFEGFDANSGGIELSDNCWVNEHISGDGSDLFMVYIDDNDGNSTHQLLLPDMVAGTMTKLMLPEMDIPSDDYYFFIDVYRSDYIWSGNDLYEGEGIRIFASTDGEIAGATELAFIPRHRTLGNAIIPAEAEAGWYTYKMPIGNTGTTYIIIRGESQYNDGTTMDNFMVQECNVPATTDARTVCETELPYTWNDVVFNTAGTQDAVLTAANGCDSVVTMTLTVNTTTYGIDEVTECDSYTWIDGNTYTESTNTPTHTLTNAAGCDSVVTLHLTINYSNTGIDEVTECDTYTWIDGNTYTESTNTPTYTLTNVAGCDSVVTLHLTINYSNTGIDEVTECDTYTWIDGNTYTESTNTPTYTLTNAAGCDSVVTLHLTINQSNTGVDEVTECNSYTWIDGNTYTESTNTPTYTLTNAAGCDSVVTLHLTINQSNTGIDEVTECDSYTWIDGNTYTESTNTPTYTLTNVTGCDSVVTLHLTINYSNTGIDEQVAYGAYEWIDGVTYTESTNTPTYTLTNAAGCDSVVTLHLTLYDCQTPVLEEEGITDITVSTANVEWTGNSGNDSYEVNYRKAESMDVQLSEGFENSVSFANNWTVVNYSPENEDRIGRTTEVVHNGDYGFSFSSYSSSSSYEEYLINNNELTGITDGVIEFYYKKAHSLSETFKVGYSNTDNDPASFTFGEDHVATMEWQLFHEAIPAGTKYVSIQYTSTFTWYLYIDDITIGNRAPAGEWLTEDATTNSTTLTGLEAETEYEVRVQGMCDGGSESEWSDTVRFTTLESCPSPTELTTGTITNHSIELSWTENGSASAWQIMLNDDEDNLVAADANPFILDGLELNTTYIARVRAYCSGSDQSEWSNQVNFTTLCDGISDFPWTENFNELTEENSIPDCWNNNEGTTVSNAYMWSYVNATSGNGATNGTSHDGSKCVRFDSYVNPNNCTNFLKTIPLALPDTPMELTFWYKNPTGGDFSVYISTDGGSTHETALATGLTDMATWVKHAPIDLSAYAGQNVVIVFKGTSNYGSGDAYIYLDDVMVKEIPSCVIPTELTATATTNSADLSWTANSGETEWTIYWKESSEDDYAEVTGVTDNPYTLTGLDAGAVYAYYVVANCSDVDASEPSDVYEFYTECEAVTAFPWTEDFEGFAANGIGIALSHPCWVNEHITGAGTRLFNVNTTTQGDNSTNKLQLPDMTAGTQTKLVLPAMGIPTDDYYFFLDVYRNTTTYEDYPYQEEGIRVFASTDGEIEGATELAFIPRHRGVGNAVIPAEEADGWYTYRLPIGNAGTTYIILRGESQYCTNTYMDNFIVQECNITGTEERAICEAELPYTWNDVVFGEAGTQDAILTAANGCDSVVTMTLTVNYPTAGIDEQVACESYEWIDGVTYTESNNTATYTLTNAAGCDSIVTLNLTINNPVHTAIAVVECDSYTWTDGDEATYTASGDYTYSHEDANGCTQVDTLHLTINHSTAGVDEQVACDSYEWIDGVTYTESTSTPTYTLTNAAGCDSIVTLHLTINHATNLAATASAVETYTWNHVDATTATYTESGVFTYEHADANGCTQVDTLYLTIYQASENEFAATACESYTWNEQTYTASGDYVQNFTDIHGADSTVTLHLTINNPVHTSMTAVACDTYTWTSGNGTTYTASGDYTYTHDDANGCEQVDTLHLTINYSTTAVDVQTACDSYEWIDGVTYTESNNTATFTLTNAAGCDSIVTLNLTINHSTTGVDEQVACDSYEWIDGVTYTESNSTATFTLTNAAGCDSVVTLHLTINYSTAGVDEQVACDSYEWIDGVTYTESNSTATYTLTNAAGCDSIVTLNLTINNPVHTAIAVVECDSYTWTDGDEATYTASGDYTYSHADANGCTQVDTLHLTINHSTAGVDEQVACDSYEWIDGVTYTESNNTATFTLTNAAGCDSIVTLNLTINHATNVATTASAVETYTWNHVDATTATYTESGVFTYEHADANGCTQVDTLYLTIYQPSEYEFAATACESYTWNDQTYTVSGDYVQNFTDIHGADSTVTLHLTINNPVHTAVTVEECETYTWTSGNGMTYTVSGEYFYTHDDANGCEQVDTLHLTINHSTAGVDEQVACDSYEWIDGVTYTESNNTATFTLTNAAGCDSIVTLNLTINHATNLAATATAVGSYTWTSGNGTTYTESGVFTYEHADANGCTQVDTLYLTIYQPSEYEFAATACESYTWNEQTYTTSGDYVQNFTDIHGADSTVTLHLTINNPVHTAVTVEECETYTWTSGNGMTYTVSGEYFYTHDDANGCEQVDTLHLTINHSTAGVDEQVACDSYEWIDGVTYTESTSTPTHTLTNAAGCDSIVTLNLTINHATNLAATATAVGSYTWTSGNGTTYTESGVFTYEHADANGCTQVDTLYLTIYQPSEYEFAATACESYTWNDQTYTVSGDYVQNFTDIHGADSTVTLHLTINNPVHTAVTVEECETYTWTSGNGTTYTASGEYFYTHDDANGCTQVDTLHLTINHATTGVDEQVACDSYEWIDGVTYTESNNTATHTLTNAAGCDSIVTLNLTINHATNLAATATAVGSYTWTSGNGTTYTESGVFTYEHADANGCTQVDTLYLTIYQASEYEFAATACESYTWNEQTYTTSGDYVQNFTDIHGADSTVTLHLTINNPVHTAMTAVACDTYTWTSGNGTTYTVSGDYTYTHDDANGCTQVDTLHLTINHATTGVDEQVACDSYEWIDGVTYTESNSTATFTLTNAAGCDSIVTLNLTINHSYNVTDELTIAAAELPYEWNGVTFTEAGTQSVTLQTVNGCDSVVTMTLTVTTEDTYTITVNVSDETPWGTVTGSGNFAYGSIDTLIATPFENYVFAGWSDLNTDNPRLVEVTQDSSFTAFFLPEEIVVPSNDSTMGSVVIEINGPISISTMVTITAVPEPHYHFVSWSDGNTENPRIVTALEALSLTAIFAIDQHTITVLSANPAMGTVTPGGTYDYGTEISISADANPNYEFLEWNDGNTDNPRNITVEQDSTFIAYFQFTDVNDAVMPNINVYSYDNQIVIVNAEGFAVEIFDMSGRLVVSESKVAQSVRQYTILAPGIYLVKVGDSMAKKVTILTK